VFLLSKSARYYYDADAIREGPTGRTDAMHFWKRGMENSADGQRQDAFRVRSLDGDVGRNKRSVWEIATEAFPEAHFATYPTALVEPCIKAGTSEKGSCPTCGAPWLRVTETEYLSAPTYKQAGADQLLTEGRNRNVTRLGDGKNVTTTGWQASCTHDLAPVPCTVLDPFAGAGTTLLVADRLQRDAIGIELSPTYAAMARRRVVNDAPLLHGVPYEAAEPIVDKQAQVGSRTYTGFNERWDAKEKMVQLTL
jgi:hypothetical protein